MTTGAELARVGAAMRFRYRPDVSQKLHVHFADCCCTVCRVTEQRAAYASANPPPEWLVRLVAANKHKPDAIYRSEFGPAFGFVWQMAFAAAEVSP